jgi:hypothetical protein
MEDNAKYCGKCGMFLNKTSEVLVRISTNFAWIWRRSWAGFAAGFMGWIIVFIISRMIGKNISPMMNNMVGGMICGVFLGVVGGIVEESAYKAFWGGILGTIGGGLGGFFNIPVTNALGSFSYAYPLSILATWAIGGTLIGATSGIIERDLKKAIAGAVFGFFGGAAGGLLGSIFYGSLLLEFKPDSWIVSRFIEGASGGLVGAILWFCVGIIEKVYIFNRSEDSKLNNKKCVYCGASNDLTFWYCITCGKALQVAAPRQKMLITGYRGLERVANAFRFMSWLFGVTGVITTPVIFFVFLSQDMSLAFISAIFSILISYLLVVGFRSVSDFLSCLMKISCQKA